MNPVVVGDGLTLAPSEYTLLDDPENTKYAASWGYGQRDHLSHHIHAFFTHKYIINEAKKRDLDNFLMLEDDAYLIQTRFRRVLDVIGSDIGPDDYDLLYLGWWKGDENDDWNKSIEDEYNIQHTITLRQTARLGGLHGVIINKTMYDTILSLPPNNPIDSQLNQIHHKIRTLIVCPKIIHIKSIYSFCEGSTIQRNML